MVLYHGTTKLWLASILKEGLKPCPQNGWDLVDPIIFHPFIDPSEGKYVFLTESLKRAETFAEWKAKYMSSNWGTSICNAFMTKAKGTPIVKTTPVVLKVSLPEGSNLLKDKHDPQYESFKYKGVIQPSSITVLS